MNTPLQKTKKNAEAIATPTDDAIAPLTPSPSPLYPTDQYRALGIPHCAMCGEKARTGMHGEVICAIADANCVRLKQWLELPDQT